MERTFHNLVVVARESIFKATCGLTVETLGKMGRDQLSRLDTYLLLER